MKYDSVIRGVVGLVELLVETQVMVELAEHTNPDGEKYYFIGDRGHVYEHHPSLTVHNTEESRKNWVSTTLVKKPKIGIIDSGICENLRRDLEARGEIINVMEGGVNPMEKNFDYHGHGTHIFGIIHQMVTGMFHWKLSPY